jgi:hypothetical protein
MLSSFSIPALLRYDPGVLTMKRWTRPASPDLLGSPMPRKRDVLESLKRDELLAASRGSGNANKNKEKAVRKWFVEQDLIEGVIYLPENLFYNTSAEREHPRLRAGDRLDVRTAG